MSYRHDIARLMGTGPLKIEAKVLVIPKYYLKKNGIV